MDYNRLKEILASAEDGKEALDFFESENETLRTEAKNQRISKGELLKLLGAENKDDAVEKITNTQTELNNSKDSSIAFKELLASMGATNKDDVLNKISKLEESLGTIRTERETEKTDRIKAENEKETALLNSGIIEAISNKKLDDKGGMIRDTMTFRAKKDDDSGNYLIDGKNFNDFLQGQIDAEIPQFKTKPIKEELPSVNDDAVKAAATRETMGLPPLKE